MLPLSAGAALLLMGRPEGLYCLAATIVATLISSAINAWVLLVEILR